MTKNWDTFVPTDKKALPAETDFRSLNKIASRNRIATAHQQYEFRKNFMMRKRNSMHTRGPAYATGSTNHKSQAGLPTLNA